MAEGRESRVFSTKTLYDLGVKAMADDFFLSKKHIVDLPEKILFDVYYQMFQALMDHGTKIGTELAIGYSLYCLAARKKPPAHENIINLGLRLGGFLSDAGWYCESERVLLACKELCLTGGDNRETWCRTLDCCHKLLHAQAVYCAFRGAAETHELALSTVEKLKAAGYGNTNHAALYAEFSVLFFTRSEYDKSYRWSLAALKELVPSLPARITINVLRQAAKSCVVKREFQRAGLLIRQAVYLAREVFDTDHPKYCDVLLDYGFYLLNYDSIANSVSVYETALNIRKAIFGKTNLLVAIAYENLAYALYVHEYTSGRFQVSSDRAGRAIEIMEKLLPSEHLMLAGAKRVKALILEEIALDSSPMSDEENLLLKSEGLHLSALLLAQTAFGERNVQTAKHYGNLGRLYQSMRRFEEAEIMHLKAIGIKKELLGPDDYEMALSIGHLASLYNFHMGRYRDAEQLYLRSIAINIQLFGKSYSGLEYDYRGLLHLYTKLNELDKTLEYVDALNHWKELRDQHAQSEDPPIDLQKRPQPIDRVIDEFFAM
ncbi:amyloid protein-binding protein 2 isoform X2 [Venturia canescens]|uniref:amyloid protein-binding protein 2 isoform X2 n=1 Tax=Venturia canescens TaxID=32260 RepID=UPI001C9C07AE|nr:amyloid protein-binding protein 2 isoform X2 [Venturia canescens]